jgi:MarR family transcriptional regulator, lower aerobic nicotinate degradation pathway regulator
MGANTSRRQDVQALLDGIRRIVHGLHESSRDAQRRTGLTGAQLFVLRRLADAGPLSVNELAVRTFTHQSSVSAVVSRLVARRFVEQRPDPHDRRRRILTLTRAGRTALAAAPHAAQDRLIAAVLGLSPGTRRTVAGALARVADAMAAARRPVMFFEERRRHG